MLLLFYDGAKTCKFAHKSADDSEKARFLNQALKPSSYTSAEKAKTNCADNALDCAKCSWCGATTEKFRVGCTIYWCTQPIAIARVKRPSQRGDFLA